MPIIQYEDGTQIEFDRPPTPEDIDEAYNSVNPEAGIKKTVTESLKQVGAAATGFAEAINSSVYAFGEHLLQDKGKKALSEAAAIGGPITSVLAQDKKVQEVAGKVANRAGTYLAKIGQEGVDYWRNATPKIDPSFWAGRFGKRNTWQKSIAAGAGAIPSLAAAASVTMFTKNPWAGAGVIGTIYASDEYKKAREAGKSPEEAGTIGLANAVANTVLERLPMESFLKAGKPLARAAIIGVQEGTEEALQQITQNTIAKMGYDRTREYFEGVAISAVAGIVSGGFLGGVTKGHAEAIDAFEDELKAKGATDDEVDALRNIIPQQIAANGEEIEKAIQEVPVIQEAVKETESPIRVESETTTPPTPAKPSAKEPLEVQKQKVAETVRQIAEPEAVADIKEGIVEARDAYDVKEDIIAKLEGALKKALPRSDYENVQEVPKVSFHITGDGDFTVINTKEAIGGLLKKVEKMSASMKPPLIGSPTVRGLPPLKFSPKKEFVSVEGGGFVTDGHFLAVSKTLPKNAKIDPHRGAVNKSQVESILSGKGEESVDLIQFQTGTQKEGYGISQNPIRTNMSDKKGRSNVAVFSGKSGKDVFVDQNYVLYFRENFKNLTYERSGSDAILVNSDGKRVGVIISFDSKKLELQRIKPETERKPKSSAGRAAGRAIPQGMNAKVDDIALPKDATTPERINKTQIISFVEKTFGVPVRDKLTARMSKLSGFYETRPELIRLKTWGNLETLTHELAHHIDNVLSQMQGWTAKNKSLQRGTTQWYRDIAPKGMKKALVKELASLDYDQSQRRTEEGFAEYMRHWLTDTGEAQAKAPVFHKAFHEMLAKPEHKKLSDDLNTLKKFYQTWKEQGALNRVLSQIDFKGEHTKRPILEQLQRSRHQVILKMEDELYPLKQAEEELGLEVGKNLKPSESPFTMATFWKQKAGGIARTFVERAAVDEHGNNIGPSLREVLKPIPEGKMKEFIAYWVSRRALHLEKMRGKESGFDVGDAKAIIKEYASPTFDNVAQDLTEWSNHIVNWVVRSGGLSSEVAEVFRKLNPIYVPFHRAFLEETKITAGGKLFSAGAPFKRFKGSGRPIINPLETLIQQTTTLIARAQRIRIGSLIVEMAEKTPGGGAIANRIPLPITMTKLSLEQIAQNLKKTGRIIVEEGAVMPGEDVEEGMEQDFVDEFMNVFTSTTNYRGKGNVVHVFKNGELRLYEIHPDLYKAMQSVDPIQITGIIKFLSPFTRLLRLGATGLNVTFGMIRNPVKDALTYATYSKGERPTPLDPLAGIIQDITDPAGSFAERFKNAGGDISSQMGYDRAQTMAVLDDALLKNLGAKGKVLMVVKHPIDTLRRIVNIPEMGPRISEGSQLMEKLAKEHPDWSPEDVFIAAFNAAQDITVNFSKSGSWGKQINQAVFAFNASVQGLNKFYRSMRENPVRTAIRGIIWLALPAIAAWYRNKDEEWYKNLDPTLKYNNLFFEYDDMVVRLPIPYDIGTVFSSFPVALLDAMYYKEPELFQGVIDIALKQVPFPTPDIIGPVWDVATNKDYMNRPIESMGVKFLPTSKRVKPWTPEYAVKLSEGLGRMGIKLSPIQIEYLVNNYTGGFGKQAGSIGKEIKEPSDLPLIGPQILRQKEKPLFALDRYYTRLTDLREQKQADELDRDEQAELFRLENFDRNQMRLSRNRLKEAQVKGDTEAVRKENLMQSEMLKERGFSLSKGQEIRNRVAERYKVDRVVEALQKATSPEQKIEILKAERSRFSSKGAFEMYLNNLRIQYPKLVSREVRARINAR